MGFVDKLQFWKKEDDFSDLGLDDDFNMNDGIDPSTNAGLPPMGDTRANLDSKQPETGPPKLNPSDYATPPAQNAGAPPQQAYQQMYSNPTPAGNSGHEIELISSKLDALKATMENINQRLANLERMAAESETGPKRRINW